MPLVDQIQNHVIRDVAKMFKFTPNSYSSNPDKISNKRNTRGFSLIEVLIALLILAIGVLGIAALQFKGLRYSHDAFLRSQINFLAYDIGELMRSNRSNAASYVSNYTVPAATGANTCNYATASTATNDLGCWHNRVDLAIPPGSTASIVAFGSLYTVALSWTDRESSTHTINYTFQP
jgi:type IV pilus assembly protein PilV